MTKIKKVSHLIHLTVELARRDMITRYAGSFGGMFWHIGVPIIYTFINVMVFSMLMSGRMGDRYGGVPFVLFYLVPFSLWSFFSEVTLRSTNILREYSYLINKIAFPYWILPVIPIAGALLNQIVILMAVGIMLSYHGFTLGDSAYIYLILWFICCCFALGVSYAVSAMSVYIPDLSQIVPIFVNVLFWLTPILYSPALVMEKGPQWVQNVILHYNPFFYLVEMARDAVLGTASLVPAHLVLLLALSLVCLLGGLFVFAKLKAGFADVV